MSVFKSSSYDQHELVAFHEDSATGLKAIIAVHNSRLGPAVGGCRMYDYADEQAALEDVLRLSRGMTYKSALAGLPMGGGKSVIIGNPATEKTPELMRAMGVFVERLGGRYITAEDSGTTVEDIKYIGERTSYISGVSDTSKFGGDPSPYTAYGVFCGIKAAVKHKLGKDNVSGIRVAIQGVGSVGRHLTQELLDEGAVVYVADVNITNLERAKKLGAEVVSIDDILSMDVDVLAPCAMGAVVNDKTIDLIKAPIIAGGANNQLATPDHGLRLHNNGVLYAPDFVINAGGIIDVHYQQNGGSHDQSKAHVERISGVLDEIFTRSLLEDADTSRVAEAMAEEIFLKNNRVEGRVA